MPQGVTLSYRSYIGNVGWQNWVNNGQISGDVNGLGIQGIELILNDSSQKNYRISYRVYIKGYGWQSWKENGQTAGEINSGKIIEALQVRFIKGDSINSLT